MHPYEGYWVKVLADGVALRFMPEAQEGMPDPETVLAGAMRQWNTWLRNSLPSPRTAIAGSDARLCLLESPGLLRRPPGVQADALLTRFGICHDLSV